MVEFALAFPIFFGLLLAAIQFGLLLVWYGDEVRLTRDSARWLALNPASSDATVALKIESLMMPGTMPTINVTPIPGTPPIQGNAADLVDDPSALAVYQIGKLTAKFTPCLPDGSPAANCTYPNRSPDGGTVHVQLSYDASIIIFLPVRLDLPFMKVQMPTSLPLYDTWMTTE